MVLAHSTTRLAVAIIVTAGACSAAEPEGSASEPRADDNVTANTSSTSADMKQESTLSLDAYPGTERETSGSVPHVQLNAAPIPDLDAELRRRLFLLPGIENRPSDRSLPGAEGLAFTDQSNLAHPEAIAGSSEFAHIHPDGSLHIWTSVESAAEIDATGWGELHPWVGNDGFWPGVVMVFTPETSEDVDIVIEIVVDSYNYVTGSNLTSEDIP